jgi:hypothetical protein
MKIISGGQTGADRAALDVAIERGLEYGGSVPKGRLAEDGPIDAGKYPCLIELEEDSYIARTRKNVEDADATLAFTGEALTGGTKMTLALAREQGKPCLHIDLHHRSAEEAVQEIVTWLQRIQPQVLNVAGSRESEAPGIYAKVSALLRSALVVGRG